MRTEKKANTDWRWLAAALSGAVIVLDNTSYCENTGSSCVNTVSAN